VTLTGKAPHVEPAQLPELTEEFGIPVLRAGQPLDPSVVDAVRDSLRHERDLAALARR